MKTIGITDCGEKYPIYRHWIESGRNDIQTIKLSYHLDNLADIKKCQGILLTGGEDIFPKFYGKPDYWTLCNPYYMDEQRDEFEWKVCQYIFENRLPVLGICRGLQVMNVFMGGTLIPDIPTTGKVNHSSFYEGKDRYHEVNVIENSQLAKIVGTNKGEINSAHHQSADLVAKGLVINSLSDEGVVEGLEWEQPKYKPFLLLVQWHPERIENAESNIFSYKIKNKFLEEVLPPGSDNMY